MPLEEKDIRKLLRLKRYEQPPPGYYDKFLADFHRRQRTELLRLPLWKIALERVNTFFESIRLPQTAYATAVAAFLILAVGIPFWQTPSSPELNASFAEHPPSSAQEITLWNDLPELPRVKQRVTVEYSPAATPRYVLDVRPVSYEAPYSF